MVTSMRSRGPGPSKSGAGGNSKRSFGGCTTCRHRHIKCDERHPTCRQCLQSGVDCEGYQKGIFFASKDVIDGPVVRFRRPLLTEAERSHMSEHLTSSVHPKLALSYLAQIDLECENAAADSPFHVHRGPFGAFRSSQAQPTPFIDLVSSEVEVIDYNAADRDNSSPIESVPENGENSLSQPILSPDLSPTAQGVLESFFVLPGEFDVPYSLEFDDSLGMDLCFAGQALDCTQPWANATSEQPDMTSIPLSAPSYQFTESTMLTQLEYTALSIPSPLNSIEDSIMRQEPVVLLRHYTSNIATLLTPFRHNKTPWHVLFIPHAKNCLAALALGEQLDDASLTMFHGMLAVSAFSMGGMLQSPMWLEQGRRYKEKAREYVRLMLRTAYDTPKRFKYKTCLMALLTMVQISMISGNRDQVDCYLLEAEKFIRLRGLQRSKSRKVRLLHHCYAYERVFHESTFMYGRNSPHRHHVREAVRSSGLVIYGQDSLYFRLPTWRDLDQELLVVKTQEEGENDLHVERPGIFASTLYPEIFGLPEHYIFLLSMTIRLGNEKDDAEQQDRQGSFKKDFFARTKEIERHIKQLQMPNSESRYFTYSKSGSDQPLLANVLEMMAHALAIYFYRRIYDLDSSILQQHVQSVRDCLLKREYIRADGLEFSSTMFSWPAFISACEAEDPDVRASFIEWFESSGKQTGLPSFSHTLKIIEQIWEEKRQAEQERKSVTWLDLMKHNIPRQLA